jgi:hypothetical protein
MRVLIVLTMLFVMFTDSAHALSQNPPIIFPMCGPDAQSSMWNISLEGDGAYQWADNEDFVGYIQGDGMFGYNFLTTPRIERIWVRWASDHDSVTSADRATKGCASDEPSVLPASEKKYRVFLPLVLGGEVQQSGEIEFKVWRRCISGQVIDKPAKNLPFIASSPSLWISGTTNVVGEGRVTGTRFTIYLGTDKQEAGEVWFDPNAEPFYLWYVDNGC